MYTFYVAGLVLCLISILIEKFIFKNCKWLNLILFFMAIIVMVNADNVGDLSNYEEAYQETIRFGIRNNTDIGYAVFMLIGSKLGLSFFQFKCLGISIAMFIIYNTLTKYTNYCGFFVFFFSLHSMFLDAYQLRNFFAFAVVIYALRYLLDEDYSILLYIVFVLLASTIHAMAIVYIIFIWIRLNTQLKNWLLRLLPAFFLLCIYLGVNTNLISNLLILFADFTDENVSDKLMNYASTKSQLGFLTPVIIYIGYLLFIKLLNSKIIFDSKTVIRKSSIDKFIFTKKNVIVENRVVLQLIEEINFIGLVFLPFNIASLTFYRLVRNICLFDLIYFAICYDACKNKKMRVLIFFGVFILISLWRFFDFNIYKGIEINEIYFYK